MRRTAEHVASGVRNYTVDTSFEGKVRIELASLGVDERTQIPVVRDPPNREIAGYEEDFIGGYWKCSLEIRCGCDRD